MIHKITSIKFYHTNKENQPLLDKNSRPYTRINMKTEQGGETWMSGLAYQGDSQMAWKIGDSVEIETKQNGQYTNFNVPKKQAMGGLSPDIIEKLFAKLDRIETKIDNLELVDPNEPEAEPLPEELPPF